MREYLAELIATFALVFIGAGAVIANPGNIVAVAFAHGLVLMAMIYALGHISGAHVNPAVTVAMMATKQIGIFKGIGYIVSQLVGAAIAGFLLSAIFTGAVSNLNNLGAPALGSGVNELKGVAVEAVLTFFLVFTIFGTAVDKKGSAHHAGLAIGMVLAFDILAGGALTGAAMNPARAFGPALAAGFWTAQWVYWIGPILGALIAGLLYKNVLMKE